MILLTSDGKDVDSWGAGTYRYRGQRRRIQVGVSTWVALFNFVASKALAVAFAEAVAVSWWVDALQGQTLGQLHFRWEVSHSLLYLFSRKRLWSWVCVASIAFTAFTGLETLLQISSSTTTVLSTFPANMSAVVADALPAGFSGVIAAIGHDSFGTSYLTSPYVEIIQNYTAQSPIHLELSGCASTSNVSCTTTLHGIGFQYTCTTGRSDLLIPIDTSNGSNHQSTNTVFRVAVGATQITPWAVKLDTLWQDRTAQAGLSNAVANCNCILVPVQVEYPVNVTQGVVTLQPANSVVNTTGDINGGDVSSFKVDKVLKVLTMTDYDERVNGSSFPGPGTHSTVGGIILAFDSLFTSAIGLTSDITNAGADLSVTGPFAAPYAQFSAGTSNADYLNNTFSSPVNQLLNNIRDIMFRSSIAIAQQDIRDYTWNTTSEDDTQNGPVPAQKVSLPGQYRIYHTVYQTNTRMLGIGLGLMLVAVLAILPLFWGFWRLGRDVSMSPFEVAKALHTATDQQNGTTQGHSVLDLKVETDQTHVGSNLPVSKLVAALGETKVRYGEVAPNVLGLGLDERTERARRGWRYR